MARAVIYTRVSTDKQESDGDSLDVQEQDCRADCEKYGDVVVAVESDTYSGHDSLDERNGMWQAIRMIQRGDADVLVVKRVNRAGRDLTDNLLLLRYVSDAGGTLRAVVEGPISDTAFGKFMLSAHGYQAEADWENIRQQTRQGIQSRVARGRPLVSVPLFGYRCVDGERTEKYHAKSVFVIDPEVAPIVQDIFEKADEGWSIWRIGNCLNDQKTITPSRLQQSRGELGRRHLSTLWSPVMVRSILSNESYTGRHAANRYQSVKVKRPDEQGRVRTVRKIKRRDPGDAAIVHISIPALVDDAVWQRVQTSLKTRQLDDSSDADEPLLNKGIAICGVCGARMISSKHRSPNEYRIYCCSLRAGRPTDRSRDCPGRSYVVKASEVDRDIWNKVRDIIRDGDRFKRLVRGKTAELAERHADAVQRAGMVARELADTKTLRDTTYRRMMAEIDDGIAAMHRAELQRLNETVAGLEKRASQAQSTVDAVQVKQDTHRKLLESVAAITRATERVKADPVKLAEIQAKYEQKYPGQRFGSELEGFVAEVAANEVDLDSLSREEKRRILKALDVQVKMYPTNSEYARTHETRWEFTFSDSARGVPPNGSSFG
ncbi:MAG: recombinase family protein [Ktedonobacterales bacterium]